MSNQPWLNRPLKFGSADRREYIVENGEVSLVAINDTSGNPIFLGRAKSGVPLTEDKWQIRKITYDAAQGVTRVEWPEDEDGHPSTNYHFVWSTLSALTITNITQAATAVVTVSSIGDLSNGDLIVITGVLGMTQVNFDGTNVYTVANISGSTFQLSGVNSTGYTAYASGGQVDGGEFLGYTYG